MKISIPFTLLLFLFPASTALAEQIYYDEKDVIVVTDELTRYCNSVDDFPVHNCVARLQIELSTLEDCHRHSSKLECITALAAKLSNVDICKALKVRNTSFRGYSISYPSNCYERLAKQLNDSSICELIDYDVPLKYFCLSEHNHKYSSGISFLEKIRYVVWLTLVICCVWAFKKYKIRYYWAGLFAGMLFGLLGSYMQYTHSPVFAYAMWWTVFTPSLFIKTRGIKEILVLMTALNIIFYITFFAVFQCKRKWFVTAFIASTLVLYAIGHFLMLAAFAT